MKEKVRKKAALIERVGSHQPAPQKHLLAVATLQGVLARVSATSQASEELPRLTKSKGSSLRERPRLPAQKTEPGSSPALLKDAWWCQRSFMAWVTEELIPLLLFF